MAADLGAARSDECIAETERLILRPWRSDELPVLRALLTHAETMKFWPTPLTDTYIEDWLDRAQELWRTQRLGRWAIERRADGRILGDCGLVPTMIEGRAFTDLGYILHAEFHGQGYGEEAARAALQVGRDRELAASLVIHMEISHHHSRRIAEKLGFEEAFRFANPRNAGKTHTVFMDRSAGIGNERVGETEQGVEA